MSTLEILKAGRALMCEGKADKPDSETTLLLAGLMLGESDDAAFEALDDVATRKGAENVEDFDASHSIEEVLSLWDEAIAIANPLASGEAQNYEV